MAQRISPTGRTPVIAHVSPTLRDRLVAVALASGLSMSAIITRAIDAHLNQKGAA